MDKKSLPGEKWSTRKKGNFSGKSLEKAINLVMNNIYSVRKAAKASNVTRSTLHRHILKKKKSDLNTNPNTNMPISFEPQYGNRRIFSMEQEKIISDYLKKCSAMSYGLTPAQTKELAYKTAKINNSDYPKTWDKNKQAGIKWLRAFLKRNADLSIRKPEACSLSRLTSFNKHNVSCYFNNLQNILEKNPKLCDPTRQFNLDETATTTIQVPGKIIATKGSKQVYCSTSGERGELVTTCAIVSASGATLPPCMIFPRKFFKDPMLHGAPIGTLGLANQSGWMNEELFVQVMDHFIKYSNSSKESPSLLIFDNHDSHISVDVIEKAEKAGVVILTLPPHCSQKMQPLDVSVFGPFKHHYNAACDLWMRNNPGKTITIYNVAECVGQAFLNSFTPMNIISGFKACGISPFNPKLFSEADFVTADVSDRPLPMEDVNQNSVNDTFEAETNQEEILHEIEVEKNIIANAFVSPESFQGFPKAQPRKKGKQGRPKGRSIILTDPEEKENLLGKKREREEKADQTRKRKAAREMKMKETAVKNRKSKCVRSSNEENGEKENQPLKKRAKCLKKM